MFLEEEKNVEEEDEEDDKSENEEEGNKEYEEVERRIEMGGIYSVSEYSEVFNHEFSRHTTF